MPNDLVRDFHTSAADATFCIALPKGDYTCVAVIGDPAYPPHPIDVRAKGASSWTDSPRTAARSARPNFA